MGDCRYTYWFWGINRRRRYPYVNLLGVIGDIPMSKRKPHNPTKRLITQCQIAVKDLALSMVQSWHEKGVELRKYETGKAIAIGQSVAQALDRCAFKWAILLIVYAQDANGKRKVITDWQRLAAPYRHCDLVEWLHKEHSAMIRNCKAARMDCATSTASVSRRNNRGGAC